jgi:hypothetical protein
MVAVPAAAGFIQNSSEFRVSRAMDVQEMKAMNNIAVPEGVAVVTAEERLLPKPLPNVITPEWMEERLRQFATSLQFDVATVVDTVINHRTAQAAKYGKPILLVSEAAALLGISIKRFKNIIYEEKARLGRLPDFVCDANGVIQQRIITDDFLKWVKQRKQRAGRPFKNDRGRSA